MLHFRDSCMTVPRGWSREASLRLQSLHFVCESRDSLHLSVAQPVADSAALCRNWHRSRTTHSPQSGFCALQT